MQLNINTKQKPSPKKSPSPVQGLVLDSKLQYTLGNKPRTIPCYTACYLRTSRHTYFEIFQGFFRIVQNHSVGSFILTLSNES